MSFLTIRDVWIYIAVIVAAGLCTIHREGTE